MEVSTLFSKIYGEGAPLLILHGLFGMGDNWATHAKIWAEKGWQVHAIDQRNHGRSPHLSEHNYEAMAADLEAYMDQHNLEAAHLLGHSMGGKTAMHFAVSRPTRVKALIVVDIAPKAYPIHHQGYIDAMRSIDFKIVTKRSEADDQLAKTVQNAGIRQFFLKSLYRANKETFAFRFNLDAIETHLDEVGTPLKFGYYDNPTLFIAGGMSGYIEPSDHDKIYEHFPQAEIETIANAGHWVHAEAFEPFSEMVSEFLAEHQ
jgi:pimeloyl-ACP methyl ester carboxylesterase